MDCLDINLSFHFFKGNTSGLGGVFGICYATGISLPPLTSRPLPQVISRFQKTILSPITGKSADSLLSGAAVAAVGSSTEVEESASSPKSPLQKISTTKTPTPPAPPVPNTAAQEITTPKVTVPKLNLPKVTTPKVSMPKIKAQIRQETKTEPESVKKARLVEVFKKKGEEAGAQKAAGALKSKQEANAKVALKKKQDMEAAKQAKIELAAKKKQEMEAAKKSKTKVEGKAKQGSSQKAESLLLNRAKGTISLAALGIGSDKTESRSFTTKSKESPNQKTAPRGVPIINKWKKNRDGSVSFRRKYFAAFVIRNDKPELFFLGDWFHHRFKSV